MVLCMQGMSRKVAALADAQAVIDDAPAGTGSHGSNDALITEMFAQAALLLQTSPLPLPYAEQTGYPSVDSTVRSHPVPSTTIVHKIHTPTGSDLEMPDAVCGQPDEIMVEADQSLVGETFPTGVPTLTAAEPAMVPVFMTPTCRAPPEQRPSIAQPGTVGAPCMLSADSGLNCTLVTPTHPYCDQRFSCCC